MRKKLHWTQRPENRAKLSELAKARHQAKKGGTKSGISQEDLIAAHVHGYIIHIIERFAINSRIPAESLAQRVGALLRGDKGR